MSSKVFAEWVVGFLFSSMAAWTVKSHFLAFWDSSISPGKFVSLSLRFDFLKSPSISFDLIWVFNFGGLIFIAISELVCSSIWWDSRNPNLILKPFCVFLSSDRLNGALIHAQLWAIGLCLLLLIGVWWD